MNFNDIEPKEYSKETFGRCIRARREELGLSAKIFAGKIGMSPVYLSDIECGKRRAPTGANSGVDYLANMIRELEIPEEQVHAFYTMAEATYSRYGNINSYLSKKPIARLALRLADEQNITDEQWQEFIDRISSSSK